MRFEKVVTHVSNEKPRCFACECPFLLLDPDLAQQNTRSDEPVHEISNNLVCATSKASDQPAHTRSLI